jgi:hypothetical protein
MLFSYPDRSPKTEDLPASGDVLEWRYGRLYGGELFQQDRPVCALCLIHVALSRRMLLQSLQLDT